MQAHEKDRLRQLLNEVGEIYGRTKSFGEVVIDAYAKALEAFEVVVIKRVLLDLLADEKRRGAFPVPAEVKRLCLALLEPKPDAPMRSHTGQELRCLHRDLGPRRDEKGDYPQCPARLPWPPPHGLTGPAAYYCQQHRALYGVAD